MKAELAQIIKAIGFSKWGIGDIAGEHPLAEEFPKALSVVLAYDPSFTSGDEASLHALAMRNKEEFDLKFAQLTDFFAGRKVRHHVVQVQLDKATLRDTFSQKFAATRAGVGWVGKSDLLVTPEYGPRVRLGTILFDADVEADAPIQESKCGTCTACVQACPYGALHGSTWSPGMPREEIVDVFTCNGKREALIATTGSKRTCGTCQLMCPVGVT